MEEPESMTSAVEEPVSSPGVTPVETPASVEARSETRRKEHTNDFSAKILSEDQGVQRAKYPPLKHEPNHATLEKIDYLKDVDLEASVELGGTVMTVEKILGLDLGSVVELSQSVTDPVRVLINGNPYAYGEVVVIGEKFGVRITKIINEG